MNFPKLIINLEHIAKNAEILLKKLGNIELVAVTKLVLGNPKIAKILKEVGIPKIGESRLLNIKKMISHNIPGPFQLLRIPMISELNEAVPIVDEILISDEFTALKIDEIAQKYDKNIELIYMVDVGDLREGVWFEKARKTIENVAKKLKMAKITGIGTNVGCFGGVLPSKENLNILVELKEYLDKKLETNLKISGGSTVTLKLLENGEISEKINQFRVGEGILLGTDATGHRNIPYLSQNTVILEAEVIEVDYKPSVPIGEIGRDSMGRIPHFEDKGWRKRIILAIGEQDIDPSGLKPFDKNLEVLHASSDHTIIDYTNSENTYKVGDVLRFHLSYGSALRVFTSPYVKKIFV
ncbi:alanine racemase [Thermosipho melanesiensis]|uniref:Alanine racemase domain protein n=2 Tax=Thermosipho melanesiensis TaxID=46541 RepID=A6LJ36_THEM4|nr:alanine/ornithine racemase family PLP-dependent enzyme [Thermosipho melanesiensis]ABR29937.1 alanine racemase domain protein [Thermosipho melanesiensis BI429]APT73145.1 alanine racemase [Thermosipho melanesiensis]OOC38541.1 alanine racemase [Thermosipho melanesiensis]OOC40345.1 alanine racemase [Thermosipho melanesiensis]OOC40609.1 alanine racemase [Thermosipho melanesiensis]